ncbi:unnamed protein product [Heligmosomoides polygyrus]|uniref:Uncharacterized protein n=1 Tax=Heligmosomoides polygyrus TaxID=6339 RepID=A0A183FSU0_HELPZ|nr:unnamed protein product [Heligmosomoides polygyrus]
MRERAKQPRLALMTSSRQTRSDHASERSHACPLLKCATEVSTNGSRNGMLLTPTVTTRLRFTISNCDDPSLRESVLKSRRRTEERQHVTPSPQPPSTLKQLLKPLLQFLDVPGRLEPLSPQRRSVI